MSEQGERIDLRTQEGREIKRLREERRALMEELQQLRASSSVPAVAEPVDLTDYHQDIVNHFARTKSHLPFPLQDFLDAMAASGFERPGVTTRRQRFKYNSAGESTGVEYFDATQPWLENTASYSEALLHAQRHATVSV